jgi:AraC-like DNA-binding protein
MNNPKIYRTRANRKHRHEESKKIKRPINRVRSRYVQKSGLNVTIVHECKTSDCELVSSITKAYPNIWDRFSNPSRFVYVICALKGRLLFQYEGHGGKILDHGQFMVAECDHVQSGAFRAFAGGFHVVQMSFPEDILSDMKSGFPWLNFATQHQSRVKFDEWPRTSISPIMLETIYTLIRSPFDATKNMFFLRKIFQEFLILMLKSVESKGEKGELLSSHEIEIAQKAHQIILQDVRRQIPNREIAKQLGIGRTALCDVFKVVFGCGLYQCLLAERMRLAKQILTETDKSLREIAPLVGYKNGKSFFETYKRYYQHTPGSERVVAIEASEESKSVKGAEGTETVSS